MNVRLYCIDASDSDHGPWGPISTKHLRGLLGPTVTLGTIKMDRWGRTIGRMRQDGMDIHGAQVNARVAAA